MFFKALVHLSVRAWLYAEKTIGWNGVCVSQSFGELVGVSWD